MDYSYLNLRDPRILGQVQLDVVEQGGLQYLAPIAAADVWRQLAIACTSQAPSQPYQNSTVWTLRGQDANNPCSPNAADAFAAVMAGTPSPVVLFYGKGDRAEIVTTSDAGVASDLAQPGGDYAVLPPPGAVVSTTTKKKQEPVPLVLGAGAGAALGFATLGPVGAVGGAIAGGVIAAWLT